MEKISYVYFIFEASNIKIYAVLLDFAKCVKSSTRVPKIEGGGLANSGNAHV